MAFGGWAIDEAVLKEMLKRVPRGGTVLELGSGDGSAELAKHYKVYSVEHDFVWMNKYPQVEYIFAPLSMGWYRRQELEGRLPDKYDILLVDGPPQKVGGRAGMLNNFDLFEGVPRFIFFDDVHREVEATLMNELAKRLGTVPEVFTGKTKSFGVIRCAK